MRISGSAVVPAVLATLAFAPAPATAQGVFDIASDPTARPTVSAIARMESDGATARMVISCQASANQLSAVGTTITRCYTTNGGSVFGRSLPGRAVETEGADLTDNRIEPYQVCVEAFSVDFFGRQSKMALSCSATVLLGTAVTAMA